MVFRNNHQDQPQVPNEANQSDIADGRVRFCFSVPILMLSWVILLGCSSPPATAPVETTSFKPVTTTVAAQGRLMPAGGIIQVSATPGDRLELISVQVGKKVSKGTPLVVLQSQKARKVELETAESKLGEAENQLRLKHSQAKLEWKAATNRSTLAKYQKSQAEQQLELARQGTNQLDAMERQLSSLVSLRNDPLTKSLVGALEIEAKKSELEKAKAAHRSSLLAAEQMVANASLAVDSAEEAVEAAKQSMDTVELASPIASIKKQIEGLQMQLEQSKIVAPIDGVILSISAEQGEMVSTLPILEMANLEKLICNAEVHEADVGRLQIGDSATLSSAAISRPLKGRVSRIDSLVGMPQMRSPNPMARTDFRSIPR